MPGFDDVEHDLAALVSFVQDSGNSSGRSHLVATAISGARTKGTYPRDKFHHLQARLDAKAAVAVAHKILVAAFHMLQRSVAFADLGADHLDRVDKHCTAKRPVRRLDALGFAAMLHPKLAD